MRLGFLDSGIGGLTVLQSMVDMKYFASNSVGSVNECLYLADLLHLPYGPKSTEELSRILALNLEWFRGVADTVILACNTSSGLVNQALREQFKDLELHTLTDTFADWLEAKPGLDYFVVFSTQATDRIGAYRSILHKAGKTFQSIPCPNLVNLIEAADFPANQLEIERLLYDFKQTLKFQPEQIVLGCTHYPLVRDLFQGFFPQAQIIDPGILLADRLSSHLKLNQSTETIYRFFSSAPVEGLKLGRYAQRLPVLKLFDHPIEAANYTLQSA